ncbi:MAG: hypothetical protein HC890_05520 [Chloroflexaceae bacterium]|nr:hypothetical protein [Chloroflexaceae bacterium]
MKYLFFSLLGTAVLLNPSPFAIAQRTDRPDFFERGDRLLEQEVQRLQRQQQPIIVDPGLTVEGQQSGWQWHQVVFQDG